MSKFECANCGKKYSRPDMFANHAAKCGTAFMDKDQQVAYKFSDRLETKGKERCPECKNGFTAFYELTETTWVCLDCGSHFTPRFILKEVKEELARQTNERNSALRKQAEEDQVKVEKETIKRQKTETDAYGYKVRAA